MREASVMLVIKDGLVLSVARKHDATKFGLPGGKSELGETPIEAAIRETREETGVEVSKATLIYRRVEPGGGPNPEDFYAYCFYADEWSGEPRPSEEGEVKWLALGALTSGKTGAFPSYNFDSTLSFIRIYPSVELVGDPCLGGCDNTGWQSGENEGFICDYCDRACTCNGGECVVGKCLIHLDQK